jgi:hypothetical protein
MRRTAALAAVMCSITACGDGGGDESQGRPPAVPPRPSPNAGPPAFLATIGSRAAVLDDRGRLRRLLPAALEGAQVCPGARRIVASPDFSGRVATASLAGRPRWRRQVPLATTHAVACLDPSARRVALVLGADRMKSLHIVTAHSDRRLRRFDGETPLLTARRMYVTDRRGVRVYALPSGRKLATLPAPPDIHSVSASPDGRHLALTALDLNAPGIPDRQFLADLTTGAVRPIEIAGMEVIGWLAPDRLAVRTDRELLVLDPTLSVVRRVRTGPLENAIASGADIYARAGRSLLKLSADSVRPRRVGRLPAQTWLSAALR